MSDIKLFSIIFFMALFGNVVGEALRDLFKHIEIRWN
jgi:hypothetical protein